VIDDLFWICQSCGERHGKRPVNPHAMWHNDSCDVCDVWQPVTEVRDYGGIKKLDRK
jgi:hypothetical protein